ncbi:hypothetical protein MRX96_001310 [Rhipicephalus microplus]
MTPPVIAPLSGGARFNRPRRQRVFMVPASVARKPPHGVAPHDSFKNVAELLLPENSCCGYELHLDVTEHVEVYVSGVNFVPGHMGGSGDSERMLA